MTRRVASILGAGFLGGIAIACVFIAGAIAGADVYERHDGDST